MDQAVVLGDQTFDQAVVLASVQASDRAFDPASGLDVDRAFDQASVQAFDRAFEPVSDRTFDLVEETFPVAVHTDVAHTDVDQALDQASDQVGTCPDSVLVAGSCVVVAGLNLAMLCSARHLRFSAFDHVPDQSPFHRWTTVFDGPNRQFF